MNAVVKLMPDDRSGFTFRDSRGMCCRVDADDDGFQMRPDGPVYVTSLLANSDSEACVMGPRGDLILVHRDDVTEEGKP